MSLPFADIVQIMSTRRMDQSPLISKMIDVKRRIDGEWIVPMPNVDEEPDLPNFGPALVADAVEHLALKAGSTPFNIAVPALDPSTEQGRGSMQWAGWRRKAYHATYWRNMAPLSIRLAYKHLCAYATTTMLWLPDDDPKSRTYQMPRLVIRDPLTSFPEPKAAYDVTPPRNLGVVSAHSPEAIHSAYCMYPDAHGTGTLGPKISHLFSTSTRSGVSLWDVVEWIDGDDVVIGVLGPHYEGNTRMDLTTGGGNPWGSRGTSWLELCRWPNLVGMVPGVCPTAVTVSKVASAIARNLEQHDLIGKLMALDVAASEKDIFPDRYVIGKGSQEPQLVDGHWWDGRTGRTNRIVNAEAVGTLHHTPSPASRQAIDRAERNFRVSTGLSPTWGGETYGAMRTGRGMDSLMEASTDPRVAELQETMCFVLTEMTRSMHDMYRAYWPDTKFTLFSGWAGDKGTVSFTPQTHFESDENVASYPVMGADAQSLTVRLAQLRGAKAMSLQTFRRKHPDIDDAEGEETQVLLEDLQAMALESLGMLVQQGMTAPEDLGEVGLLMERGEGVFAALKLAGELAQKRQASAPEQTGAEELAPGEPQLALPPGTQPGLGPPSAGMASQMPPAIGPPPASLDNLRKIVRDMKVRA